VGPGCFPARGYLTEHYSGLDTVKRLLTQVYQDARQLVHMSYTQLLQSSTLALLDDIAAQARAAYTGQLPISTGASSGNAIWIYNNLQRLATFDVAPYTAPKQ